ncbi:MAG: HTTM domain-containing protein [Polyangiaceae bacterium]|jgi:hypothetical protein
MRRVIAFFWGPADPRAYALVRITLAFAALVNLADLWPHRYEYLALDGMVPLDGLRRAAAGKFYGSIFYSVQSEAGVTAVFIGAAVALVALGLGWWTRVAAALVFAWHLSYCHRAFPVLHGWDAILRSYSMLVLVSPAGRVWSLDGLRRPRPDDGADVPAYGLRLMQWQLFVLYFMTIWLKVPDAFWRNGQVLAYFSISQYSRTPDNLFLVHHEWLSTIGTYLSMAAEVSIPWLLWSRRTRFLGMAAGFGLHFMIGTTARLGVFSICMIPPYMAYLERGDIDRLIALYRRARAVASRSAPKRVSER